VSLRAAVAPGYAQADRIAALQRAVDEMHLPASYSTRVSGRAREFGNTSSNSSGRSRSRWMLMYIILGVAVESVVHPFTILAVVAALQCHSPSCRMGVDQNDQPLFCLAAAWCSWRREAKRHPSDRIHMNQRIRQKGVERLAAILQAKRDRLRPILMTTFTLIAALMTLAPVAGPGAEERRATAIA